VSYDIIIWATVKSQMGWEWLPEGKDKILVILCFYSKKLSVPVMR